MSTPIKVINIFEGEYAWLSNFAPCQFEHEGITYLSTEAFYQAHKFSVDDIITIGTNPNGEPIEVNARRHVAQQPANITKRLGRKAKLPANWKVARLDVMTTTLIYKFIHNQHYKELLKATGDAQLIEGNWWHDNYWGDCGCPKCQNIPGKNMLGNSQMTLRDIIQTYKL